MKRRKKTRLSSDLDERWTRKKGNTRKYIHRSVFSFSSLFEEERRVSCVRLRPRETRCRQLLDPIDAAPGQARDTLPIRALDNRVP